MYDKNLEYVTVDNITYTINMVQAIQNKKFNTYSATDLNFTVELV